MYTKQTWKNGDVITEDKLNHMEDGIATGGGIYSYGEVALFDGEVTTAKDEGDWAFAYITFQGDLPKSDISVTFNRQDYTLPHGYDETWGNYWGEISGEGPSFKNYPLCIDEYSISTSEAGTYTLIINETVEKFTVNDNFKDILLVNVEGDSGEYNLDKTYEEIYSAVKNGKHVTFRWERPNEEGMYVIYHMASCSITPNPQIVLMDFVLQDNTVTITPISFGVTNSHGYPTTYVN